MTDSFQQQGQPIHRVDGAHQESAEHTVQRPDASCVAAAAGLAEDHAAEQTQLQGHQLVTALSARQREIDRREAQFNAYLAALDNQSRTIRLKQSQRDTELATREEDFTVRFAELARREISLRGRDDLPCESDDFSALNAKARDLNERQIRLEAQENRLRSKWQQIQTEREAGMQLVRHLMRSLERRRQALEEQFSQHAGSAQKPITAPDLQRFAVELDERHQALTTAQQEVESTRRQLDNQRENLQQRTAQWEQSRQRDEARLAQLRKAQHSEHDQRSQSFDRRSEELAKRQNALEQMQASVTHAHREALELRLATEQLWSQLADQVSPRELAESLGALRAKIAEHYRGAEQSLASQRDDLHAMTQRLDEQQQNLRGQREELQQWASRRGEEIEYQAARLVAREQELEAQQHKHEQSRASWEGQRHQYEDEIRRLRAELRQGRAAAA